MRAFAITILFLCVSTPLMAEMIRQDWRTEVRIDQLPEKKFTPEGMSNMNEYQALFHSVFGETLSTTIIIQIPMDFARLHQEANKLAINPKPEQMAASH